MRITSITRRPSSGFEAALPTLEPGPRAAAKTAVGVIAGVVMSVTVIGCGVDQSHDKAKPVTQTVRPDHATRSPAGLPGDRGHGAEPRCRDQIACPK